MGRFQYFGYGSNMLTDKLKRKDRCPSAVKIDVARTNEYTLKFHKVSTAVSDQGIRDESGKGDMAPKESETDELYGVVFSIDDQHKDNLDSAEGVGWGYEETKIDVEVKNLIPQHEIDVEGITKGPLQVVAYKATEKDKDLKPYHWYKGQTVDGAKEHGLPPDYIKKIEAFESIQDRDKERVDKETAYKHKSSSNSI